VIRTFDSPLLKNCEGAANPVSAFARERVLLRGSRVAIEDDFVAIERPGCEREGCRVQVVCMNHTNRVLSGDGVRFHEEAGEFRTGHCGVGDATCHFKFLGIAIEEQKERIQATGGVQMLKLAENTGTVTGLM
jgi:hypothetical protein